MGVTITYGGTLPSLNDPSSFNDDALAFFQWVTGTGSGQLLGELANMDANDFFSVQSSPYDTTVGKLLLNGAHGLGGVAEGISDANTADTTEFRGITTTTTNSLRSGVSGTILSVAFSGIVMQLHLDGGKAGFRRIANGVPGTWHEIWSSSNTTVDGSGFILEASPIVRLYTDSISEPNKPVNASLQHTETGVYVLSGVPPLATDGWTVRTPEDMNGNKVVAINPPEYDAEAETLTLRTYDLLWQEGRMVPGDPMDVPSDYFVMLRFHEEPEPEPEGNEVAE